MITIGFSTREIDNNFIEHIKNTCGPKNIEIIPFENKGTHSLSEAYNIILEKSTNDIVVLCHDDIYFDKKSWGSKLIKHFNRNPDFGVLGAAGSISLPKSGKWWEDTSKMRGIVNHEHDGKKWESKYSNSLGNKVEETVIVDGLFIAINRKKTSENFNEEVKGFHFYDVDFSFRNHLSGVKVGVFYDIRITHKSIGQTNEEWEKNRIEFSERYEKTLPKKIYENFENTPMKILLTCLSFKNMTGSEVSTFELAKGLKEMGHDVSILSKIGPPLSLKSEKLGINLYDLSNPPGYKMGDGVWSLVQNGKQIVSKKGLLYKIKDVKFDIIQTNHKPVTEHVLKLYPNTPIVDIVRSRVLELEDPYIDERIKEYISITPEVKEYILNNFDIQENKIDTIYNIADVKEGKIVKDSPKYVLLPGTMNYLRKDMVHDMVKRTKDEGLELWLAGNDNDFGYAKKLSDNHDHVKYLGVIEDLSDYYTNAVKTCGLYFGRIQLESIQYNKKIVSYSIDKKGKILNIMDEWFPNNRDEFNKKSILEKYIEKYKKVINNVS
jgi:hypothetical protein